MRTNFQRYLQDVIERESELKTVNLRRLVPLILAGNKNLVEPVFMLAVARKKEYHLMSLVWETPLNKEYSAALRVLREVGTLEDFVTSPRVPKRYRKHYDDFLGQPQAEAAQAEKDENLKERLRQRIEAALEASQISRYRLCRDTGANPGNVYAFLAGDLDKVSLATAQRLCDQAYAYPAKTEATRSTS